MKKYIHYKGIFIQITHFLPVFESVVKKSDVYFCEHSFRLIE